MHNRLEDFQIELQGISYLLYFKNKIQKGLSAGRVQSATLKIIVDRERDIKAFKPQEYWTIEALFNDNIEASIFRV